jgi:benzoyl-CoA reductase/2-hydroxyglutaryl-CoA dehydratase subunit BcrC/BadD/HgdB
MVCPILRSSLDLGLKEHYEFLSGFVATHSCDCEEKLARIWAQEVPVSFHYFLDLPHVIRPNSFEQFKDKLKSLQAALEEYTGMPLKAKVLREEIFKHNQQRALVRELYELRKEDPPLLSGSEAMKITLTLMCLPIEEGSYLLKEIIEEVKMRKNGPEDKRVRLMMWGSPLTETNLIDMIENLEAHVVIDDVCVGSRHFWPEVEITEDPLDGLVMRYMEGIKCPRTFRETVGDFGEDMESRFGYLKAFAKEWAVDGVVLETVKYCDTHGYEVPGLKAYFEKMGIPVLYLEHEYTNMAEAQLKNRVEAFLEILE